jgi:hypothetical protein
VYIVEDVSQEILDFLKKQQAEVIIAGKYYAQALELAEEAVKCNKNGYVLAICS